MTTKLAYYRPLHPFDSVYTIVFIFFMYQILGITIANIAILDLSKEAMFYSLLVAIFFVYQLSRMYYYLKNFEEIIVKKGNHHFLEILPIGYQAGEKTIRVILAFIIVLFPKVQTEMDVLSLTLIVCFSVLIVWDVIVIKGLKKTIKQDSGSINLQSDSYKTAKSFFYLLDKEITKNRIYIFKTKFFERLFGLLASATAYIYQCQDDSGNGVYIFIFGAFVGLFVFSAYYGKFKINELELSEIDEFVDDLIRPFYLPIYKLFYSLNLIR